MDWAYLLTSLEGRINRKPYWIGVLAILAVGLPIQILLLVFGGILVATVAGLIFLYPSFALNVKRAHDRNRPTWLIAVFFALLLAIQIAQLLGLDKNGDNPTTLFLLISIPWFLGAVFFFVDLGFLRGTPGQNQYGPDPLG